MLSHALLTLRALLADPPSSQGWSRLCAAVDAATGPDQTVLMDYAAAHLTAWPAELRVAPLAWGVDGADTRLRLAHAVARRVDGRGALVPVAAFEPSGSALQGVLAFLDAHGEDHGVDPRVMRWSRHPVDGRRVEVVDGVLQVVAEDGTALVRRRVAPPGGAEHHNVVFAHDPAFVWWLTGFRSGAGAVRLLSAHSLETLDVSALPDRLFGARMETHAPLLAVSSGPFAQWITFFEVERGRLRRLPVRLEGGEYLLPMGLTGDGLRYVGLGRGGALALWGWPSGALLQRDLPGQRRSLPSLGVLASGGFVGEQLVVPMQTGSSGSAIGGVSFVEPVSGRGQGEAALPTGGVGVGCVGEVLAARLLLVQELGWRRAWLYRVLGAS